MALVNCSKCGTLVSDKASSCINCGKINPKKILIECPECSTEISKFLKECPECGFPLTISRNTDGNLDKNKNNEAKNSISSKTSDDSMSTSFIWISIASIILGGLIGYLSESIIAGLISIPISFIIIIIGIMNAEAEDYEESKDPTGYKIHKELKDINRKLK